MNTLAGYRLGVKRPSKTPSRGIASAVWMKIESWFAAWFNHFEKTRRQRKTERVLISLEEWQLRDIGYPELYDRQSRNRRKTTQ